MDVTQTMIHNSNYMIYEMDRARYERGRDLNVTHITFDQGKLKAMVKGTMSTPYEVVVDIGGYHPQASCNCPDKHELCKHVGAVLLAWQKTIRTFHHHRQAV
jgi:uncharacterized Zn finger protein